MYTLTRTEWFAQWPVASICALVAFILLSKTVKLWSHWYNEPRDILLFPVNVLFAYFHSFVKLQALITFWDNKWGGRDLGKAADKEVPTEWEVVF
jgi:hypothetical protein